MPFLGTIQRTEDLSRNHDLRLASINWTNTIEHIPYPVIQDALRQKGELDLVQLIGFVHTLIAAGVALVGIVTIFRILQRTKPTVLQAPPVEPRRNCLLSGSLCASHTDGAHAAENENSPAAVFAVHSVAPLRDRVFFWYKTNVEAWSVFAAPIMMVILFALNLLLFETLYTMWETARHTQSSIFFASSQRGRFQPLMILYDRVWERGLLTFNTRIFLSVSGFLTAAFTWYITLSGYLIDFLPFFRILSALMVLISAGIWVVLQHLGNQNRSDGGTSSVRAVLYVIEAVYIMLFSGLLLATVGLTSPLRASNYEAIVEKKRLKGVFAENKTERLLHEHTALMVDWLRAVPAFGKWNCITKLNRKAAMLHSYATSRRLMVSLAAAACMALCVVFYITATVYRRELLRDAEIWYEDDTLTEQWKQPWTRTPRVPERHYEVTWSDNDGNSVLPIPGFPPEHSLVRLVVIAGTYLAIILTMFVPIRGMGYIWLICLLYVFIIVPPWLLLTSWDFQLIVTANDSWCWADKLNPKNKTKEAIMKKVVFWANTTISLQGEDDPVEIKPLCINVQYVGIAILTLAIPLLLLLFVAVEGYRKYHGGCRYHDAKQDQVGYAGERRTPHMGQVASHTHNCVYLLVECVACKIKHYLYDNEKHLLNCGGPGERARFDCRATANDELEPFEINLLVTSAILPRKAIDFAHASDDQLEQVELQLIRLVEDDIKRLFPHMHLTVSYASIINIEGTTRDGFSRSNKRFSVTKYTRNEHTAAIVTLVPPHNDYKLGTAEREIVQQQPRPSPHHRLCYHYWQPMGTHWFEWNSHKRICCDGILDIHNYQLAMDVLVITDHKDPNCWKQPLKRVLHRAFMKKQEQLGSLSQMATPFPGESPGPMFNYKGVSHPGEHGWYLSMITVYRSVSELFLEGGRTARIIFGVTSSYYTVLSGLPVLEEFALHTPHYVFRLETTWELLQLPSTLSIEQYCTLMFIVAYEYEQSVIADHLQIVHTYIDVPIFRQLRLLYDEFKDRWLSEEECQQLTTNMATILENTSLKVRPMMLLSELKFGQVSCLGYKLWGFWHMLLHIEASQDQFLIFKQALPWGEFGDVTMYLFNSFASRPGFLQVYDLERLLVACGMKAELTRDVWAELNPTEFGVTLHDFNFYFGVLVYGRTTHRKVEAELLNEVQTSLHWREPRLSHRFRWGRKVLEGFFVPVLFYAAVVILIVDLIMDDECSLSDWDTVFKILMLIVAVFVFIINDLLGLGFSYVDIVGGVVHKYWVDRSKLPPIFNKVHRIDMDYVRVDSAAAFKQKENQFFAVIQRLNDSISRAPLLRALAVFGSHRYQLPVTGYFHRDEPLIAGTIALIFFWELPLIAIAMFELFVEICDPQLEFIAFIVNLTALLLSLISLMEAGAATHSGRSITTMEMYQTQRAQRLSVYDHGGEHVPPPYLEVFDPHKACTPIMTKQYWQDQRYGLSHLNKTFDNLTGMKGQIDITNNDPIQRNAIVQLIQQQLRTKKSPPANWTGPYDHKLGPHHRPVPRYKLISSPMHNRNPLNTLQRGNPPGGALAPYHHQRPGGPYQLADPHDIRQEGAKFGALGPPLVSAHAHHVNPPITPHPSVMNVGPIAPPPSPTPFDNLRL